MELKRKILELKNNYESQASQYFRDTYGDVFVNNQDPYNSDYRELNSDNKNLAGEWDAFAHTYTSAALTQDLGYNRANLLGNLNEMRGNNSEESRNQDLWNNSKGREIVIKLGKDASLKEIADAIIDALKNGELITDRNDLRKYDSTFFEIYDFSVPILLLNGKSPLVLLINGIRDAMNALKDPLIIDLKNDGLNLSNPDNRYIESIYFDLNNNGIKEKTGWIIPKYEVINSTDGISNGFITNNSFYFEGDKEQSQQGWNISYSNITYNGIKQLINPVIDDAFLAIDKIMPQNETITESTLIN